MQCKADADVVVFSSIQLQQHGGTVPVLMAVSCTLSLGPIVKNTQTATQHPRLFFWKTSCACHSFYLVNDFVAGNADKHWPVERVRGLDRLSSDFAGDG